MSKYRVVLVGEYREVYVVEAESEQDARENWENGYMVNSEASSMEVLFVIPDE